jgi:hypothetical protein
VLEGNASLHLDAADIFTRNWILSQTAGVVGYLHDALRGRDAWLSAFWNRAFILQRTPSGKFIVMFSTSMKEPRNLGFLLGAYHTVSDDTRVMTIAGGAGSLSASGKAAWHAAAGSIKGGAGFAVAFTGVIDCISWWDEYSQGKKNFADLAATVGLDLVKAGIGAAATSLLVSIVTTGLAFVGIAPAAPVFLIAPGTMFIAIGIGYAVDWLINQAAVDKKITELFQNNATILETNLPKDYPETYATSTWNIGAEVAF